MAKKLMNYYCDLCGKRDRKRWVHESGFRLCEKCAEQQRQLRRMQWQKENR